MMRWTIAILIFVLAFFWASRVHDYFFSMSSADQFGFLIVMLAGVVLFSRFTLKSNRRSEWSITILLLLLLLSIYPLVSWLLLFSDLSWLAIYVLLILTSFALVYLFRSDLLFFVSIGFIVIFYLPYEFREEQFQFYDRVENAIQTREGEAQVVRWKEDFWLYYNQQFQFSTLDKHLYQEAYVQPVMQLIDRGSNVLLIGGENGVVEDELSNFQNDISLTILMMDEAFYNFSRSNKDLVVKEFETKNKILSRNIFEYLSQRPNQFDLIIIDVPDPVSLDFNQYYTVEFYELVANALTNHGFLVTQSGDYYKDGTEAHQIWNSVSHVGMSTLPLQCQIPTIGQWSWVIGSKGRSVAEMKSQLSQIVPTTTSWWNQEAADLMMSFGKDYFSERTDEVNYLVELVQESSE